MSIVVTIHFILVISIVIMITIAIVGGKELQGSLIATVEIRGRLLAGSRVVVVSAACPGDGIFTKAARDPSLSRWPDGLVWLIVQDMGPLACLQDV